MDATKNRQEMEATTRHETFEERLRRETKAQVLATARRADDQPGRASAQEAGAMMADDINARLVREWRAKADRLDRCAARARQEGVIRGPEGADDVQAAADDYRKAADELEFDGATGEGRR